MCADHGQGLICLQMQVRQTDAGAMLISYFLHNGQAQAGAFGLGRDIGFKCTLQHFLGKTMTVVDDLQA